ncbi:hypothetical protein BGC24_19255 [Acinetobacter baumannii]|nr:hypothetical protein BGC24_19255 [Acinetobacter baumannii]
MIILIKFFEIKLEFNIKLFKLINDFEIKDNVGILFKLNGIIVNIIYVNKEFIVKVKGKFLVY